jgi:hypothetical protein
MLRIPPAAALPDMIAALVGAVGSDGRLLPVQRETVQAVCAVYGHPDIAAWLGRSLSPAEAALAITDPALREQLVHAMVVLAFYEHPATPERSRHIDAYARALGVRDHVAAIYRDYANEHFRRMVFDIARQAPFAQWERQFAHQEGLVTAARGMLATFDVAEAPAVADKFRRLEQCPAGSLGRKVWQMYRREGWLFPGERGAVPEGASMHDWVHVLAGYPPTPLGEIQVTTFMAAASPNPHVMGLVMLALGLFEAGAVSMFNAHPQGRTMQQPHAPAALADSLRRGLAVNCDLLEGIDHWALANEPVSALRERFDVVPKQEPTPGADPGA